MNSIGSPSGASTAATGRIGAATISVGAEAGSSNICSKDSPPYRQWQAGVQGGEFLGSGREIERDSLKHAVHLVETSINTPYRKGVIRRSRPEWRSLIDRTSMKALFVIGQVLAGLYFINGGINHLTKLEAMTGYAKYKKLPAAKLGVILPQLLDR